MSFIAELKRRNVFRVGIAYIVMAWLVMQVGDIILNNVKAPDWVFFVLMMFLVIGFLFALFFAWAFELTPEGLKKQHEVDLSRSITPQTGRKLDRFIIIILVFALGYFAFDKFVLDKHRDAALLEQASEARQPGQAQAEETAGAPPNSIAVLPFVNMSSDIEQEYFSDGLSEELLNLLARIPEMQVTSRSSAFSYKGKDFRIADLGRELNVAHVLEGSVRKSANAIRITAQLIRVEDDVHLWSDTYDRTMEDIFAVQDEIAAAVVDQLKVTILGDLPTVTETNPEAYNLYLQAAYLLEINTEIAMEQAAVVLEQALDIEPDYLSALTTLPVVLARQALAGLRPYKEVRPQMQELLDRALKIDPENAHALSGLYQIALSFDDDLPQAARYLQRALELDPTDWRLQNNAGALAISLGRFEQAVTIFEYLVVRDPINPGLLANLAGAYFSAGRLHEAIDYYRKTLQLVPDRFGLNSSLGDALLYSGQAPLALEAFEKESDDEFRVKGRAMANFALGKDAEAQAALKELIDTWGDQWPSEVAHVYGFMGDANATFAWLDKAMAQGEEGMSYQFSQPHYNSVRNDPRWASFLERTGTSPALLASIPFKVTLPD